MQIEKVPTIYFRKFTVINKRLFRKLTVINKILFPTIHHQGLCNLPLWKHCWRLHLPYYWRGCCYSGILPKNNKLSLSVYFVSKTLSSNHFIYQLYLINLLRKSLGRSNYTKLWETHVFIFYFSFEIYARKGGKYHILGPPSFVSTFGDF